MSSTYYPLVLVRGNAPAPRKPEVQYDHENSYQTQIYSHQGPTKFQKKTIEGIMNKDLIAH